MDRLEQIKNAVTANGMREWTAERVNQVAREYATEVARHDRERVASECKDIAVDAYETITSLKIELI